MDGSAEPQYMGSPAAQGQRAGAEQQTGMGGLDGTKVARRMVLATESAAAAAQAAVQAASRSSEALMRAELGGNFYPNQRCSTMQHVKLRLLDGKIGHGVLNNTFLQLTQSSWMTFGRSDPIQRNQLTPLISQMLNGRGTAFSTAC